MRQVFLMVTVMLCAGVVRGQVDAAEVTRAMASERRVQRDVVRIPPDILRTERAVLLARMAVGESGLSVVDGEVAALDEVVVTRARGRNYQSVAWGYSVALRHPRRASLHRLGRAPLSDGWPQVFREHWPRVLAAADAAVAGTLRHSCAVSSPLVHWGGPAVDRAALGRLVRAGYQRAECPGYANTFLVRRGAP